MDRNTKEIQIGSVTIGGNNPITIQSMTNTKTADISSTIDQINALTDAGSQIVRMAVNSPEAARAIKEIKKNTRVPLVADIHYDYRLALEALENGIDKLRINPGNIGDIDRIRKVVEAAKDHQVPIRIGVNSGSVEKEILEKYKSPTAEALVASAAKHIQILEDLDFDQIVVSLKASNVLDTIRANELFSQRYNYPLHLGVTEAGLPQSAAVKSAIGIGSLLAQGIGDTIRVSVTGDPTEEIPIAKEILKALELDTQSPKLVSCPTCGRTEIDLIPLAKEVEQFLNQVNKDITVAVMGCSVNGPGEAREADLGLAGGKDYFTLFKKGEKIRTVPENKALETLKEEILNYEK